MPVPYLSDQEIYQLLSPTAARQALAEVLLAGFDPETDPARVSIPTGTGELLLMPSTNKDWTGVKILTLAPENSERGLPRIQALYHLCDTETLSPRLILEGESITNLRTPAVSALAADKLASVDASNLLVLGSGPQAIGHVHAMAAIRELSDIALYSLTPASAQQAAHTLREQGFEVRVLDREEVDDATRQADIICCTTSAEDPVIPDAVADGACVVAMGSHSPQRRELPSSLVHRSLVIVEDVATAWREAGDIVLAHHDQPLPDGHLHTLAQLVRGEVHRADDRPNIIKTTGMSWEDLAVAVAVAKAANLT
ncbi:ornithine cyclodeaminase family protein [Corynebacterium poyangense]|uniref:Ornithine cyclodeaminase family protein n=1 Tax=Corynebacterium poyangense TaxID=2684405 RepID=A0A7H0SNH0_9CORY|nr:ornithine cyclodeaminase family protein [Corynebacterium poyangense]QNQ90095.1 ornithine cyclodeaminase family protein [Corynebacterium poyangense]